MTKLAASLLAALFVFPSAPAQDSVLHKYPAVEAYEIRPEILAFPRYTADGQLCELGLERLHYLGGKGLNVDSVLYKEDVDSILDEVAPPAERGPLKQNAGGDFFVFSGVTMGITRVYENVTLDSAAGLLSSKHKRNVTTDVTAAVITWTKRTCR